MRARLAGCVGQIEKHELLPGPRQRRRDKGAEPLSVVSVKSSYRVANAVHLHADMHLCC